MNFFLFCPARPNEIGNEKTYKWKLLRSRKIFAENEKLFVSHIISSITNEKKKMIRCVLVNNTLCIVSYTVRFKYNIHTTHIVEVKLAQIDCFTVHAVLFLRIFSWMFFTKILHQQWWKSFIVLSFRWHRTMYWFIDKYFRIVSTINTHRTLPFSLIFRTHKIMANKKKPGDRGNNSASASHQIKITFDNKPTWHPLRILNRRWA